MNLFRKKKKIKSIEPFNTIVRNNILLNKQLIITYNDNSVKSVYTYSVFQLNNLENTPLLNHYGQHIYNKELNLKEEFLNTGDEFN